MSAELLDATVLEEERLFLDRVYQTYNVCESPTEAAMRDLLMKTFSPYINGGSALELGCSDGLMTEMLSKCVDQLDVVDGSRNFINRARERCLPNVKFIYSLFEEIEPTRQYDYVFGCYILEHVLDPLIILENVRRILAPGGLFFIAVPNARALSRQLALHMGLFNDLKALTKNDRAHGHRRVYDRPFLNRDLTAAGFVSIHEGGILLKPFADFQMDEMLKTNLLREEHINGLHRLGLEHPDLCGSLISICRGKK